MLTPSIGVCRPVDHFGSGKPGRFQNRSGDVDDVVELGAQLALGLDALGPVDDHGVAGAAEVRGDLLGPVNGVLPATAQPAA